jgi:carbamoyltransferase
MHEEPIVRTADEAIRAFQAADLDALILGPFLIRKVSVVQ